MNSSRIDAGTQDGKGGTRSRRNTMNRIAAIDVTTQSWHGYGATDRSKAAEFSGSSSLRIGSLQTASDSKPTKPGRELEGCRRLKADEATWRAWGACGGFLNSVPALFKGSQSSAGTAARPVPTQHHFPPTQVKPDGTDLHVLLAAPYSRCGVASLILVAETLLGGPR